MAYAVTALLSVLSFRRSGIARADISIIERKTRIDRRDDENGRCRSSSRLDTHSIFSRRMRSSTVIFDYAVILWRRAIMERPRQGVPDLARGDLRPNDALIIVPCASAPSASGPIPTLSSLKRRVNRPAK